MEQDDGYRAIQALWHRLRLLEGSSSDSHQRATEAAWMWRGVNLNTLFERWKLAVVEGDTTNGALRVQYVTGLGLSEAMMEARGQVRGMKKAKARGVRAQERLQRVCASPGTVQEAEEEVGELNRALQQARQRFGWIVVAAWLRRAQGQACWKLVQRWRTQARLGAAGGLQMCREMYQGLGQGGHGQGEQGGERGNAGYFARHNAEAVRRRTHGVTGHPPATEVTREGVCWLKSVHAAFGDEALW